MRADVFSPDVQEFLRCLAACDVRYVVIGGAAVIYHGYARLTGDIDFYYDRARPNAERLWRALQRFWGGDVPALSGPAELTEPGLVVQFGRPPNRIDLIADLRAVAFEDAWRTRVHETISLDGETVPVWILALAELRKAKADAGRAKDLDDLDHLGPE